MSRDSWQAARAVFLAAIMITSVFAAGIALGESAAADRSSAIQGPASDGVLTVAADVK
jgi:surface glycoprotein (TIGR04207 family)